MQNYNLPADIPDQYNKSIHGRNLLEKGDTGSPHCATCHGNHAAAPPGYLEVGHVCGKCHKQIEEYFLTSIHGRIPVMARCIGCHAGSGQRWNHQIEEASPPVEKLVEAFTKVHAEVGDHPDALREKFLKEVDLLSGSMSFGTVCINCHAPGRQGPHASFFLTSDRLARETGKELASSLREAQFEYAKTTERVARLGRGVVLVKDEALRIEDAKTELMSLYAFLHSLNRPEIQTRVQATKNICREVNAGLDQKESSLTIRREIVLLVWIFIGCFCILMYRKYMALKHAYVVETVSGPACALSPSTSPPVAIGRRRVLDVILSAMGAVSAIALLWPAVSYVLPVRKRGSGGERVSAGKEEGWAVWDAHKVLIQGKPAVVVRTDSGFRAFSAVCTHLGCIVQWNPATRDFECPCHAAKFNAEGQIVSGPPPRPLPQFGVSVVQNEVIVKDA
jgi:cytochrome b6-f complex iron-sulfur subunit